MQKDIEQKCLKDSFPRGAESRERSYEMLDSWTETSLLGLQETGAKGAGALSGHQGFGFSVWPGGKQVCLFFE